MRSILVAFSFVAALGLVAVSAHAQTPPIPGVPMPEAPGGFGGAGGGFDGTAGGAGGGGGGIFIPPTGVPDGGIT